MNVQNTIYFNSRNAVVVCLTLVISFFISLSSSAQVTLVINKVPETTPADDTLFLAGSFNEWKPGDRKYSFVKNNDSTYSITLPKGLISFQYKVTRGNWKNVEGDINGKKREDRVLSLLNDEPATLYIQILSWEDMAFYYSWNLIVKKIPDNTPFDAQIFVSGSFNDWKENDYNYKLTKLDDGTYAIKIPKTFHDTIWYKFNRGNWQSVESRKNGKIQNNRILVWDHSKNSTTQEVEIAAWEDLGGGSNLLFSFILVASALQAFVLILALLSIRRKNNRVTAALIFLLLASGVAVVARLASYDRFMFDWQPKLLLLDDVIYFLYAPAFYFLITGMAGVSFHTKILKWIFIIVPFVQLLFYIQVITTPTHQFVIDNIDGKFSNLFDASSVIACLYNTVFFILCIYLVIQKQRSVKNYGYQPSYSYLVTVLVYAGIMLSLWILSNFIYLLSPLFHYDSTEIHEEMVDLLWMLFALSIYVHTFLTVRKPELFKLRDEEDDKQKGAFPKENLEALKTALAGIMKKQKPWLNAKLGLQDLADKMNVTPHTLSWIINDGYNKNFFDFVNDYRIEEFKKLVATDQYKNYTFLAIAMEVGFSSKTTFNRAFKKYTGKTPREYFSDVHESKMKDISD